MANGMYKYSNAACTLQRGFVAGTLKPIHHTTTTTINGESARRGESNPLHSAALSYPLLRRRAEDVMPPSADSAPAAMAQSPRLHALLSFDRGADADALAAAGDEDARVATVEPEDDGFDFAFAPPVSAADLAPADDIFSHGRIVPAYPVFDRRLLDLSPDREAGVRNAASTAPPTADTYCAWTPRSAPGSPGRGNRFPKSASTGGELSSSSSSRRWRLRDLVGGRSRSDGKDKFAFLHHHATAAAAAAPPSSKLSSRPAKTTTTATQKKQITVKKTKGAVVTEMDMATAHKLFYSKAGAAAGERRPQQASYLTHRPAFSGIFALGRSQHHTAY
ncbi:uncharacterized protein LOC102722741 [Oryza brachyantha]|uniref:uncharacterized protein LOC102722741 n=1 Tax=Oryza brachyantha TaxID=4533 RepID=UPI001ADC5103|nr:uncharacterized protein LOC102722741 [Oryza brachyantha]